MTYKIELTILGEKWKSKGETLDEALSQIPLSWDQVKGKGVMEVTKGKIKHEHLFNMAVLRKMFSNKIMRAHWAKNLDFLLGEEVKTNIPK